MSERLVAARRIIVKIGSALLVDPASGRLKQPWLASLADDLKRLRARGSDIIVVTSGAMFWAIVPSNRATSCGK